MHWCGGESITVKENKDKKNEAHSNNSNYNSNSGNGNSEDRKLTKGQLVLELVERELNKLFVDEYRAPHAAIFINEHIETIPLEGRRFRNWLAGISYKRTGMVIDNQTLKDVIGVLSARAEFDRSDQIRLNLRVALGEDKSEKKWYYDLTNKNWEFIEVTSKGWKIVNNLILFHRYSNQLPQVYPLREYTSDVMEKFINLILSASVDKGKLPEYKILLSCYIICAFVPDIPKAVPMTFGHQGAAKTSLMEFIKTLVDPSAVKTLSFPTNLNELIQQLSHNYLAFYDNISTLRDRISDQLCRAVTGSGSSKRVLYSDDDIIRSFKRCIGINGINLAATKPDLLDRALFFELRRIENKDRRKLEDVWREFEAMAPQLLGYILDILVKALAWKQTHKKLNLVLPRMADWAEWCEIISRSMGNEGGAFLKAFQNNRKIQVEQIIESSQVATCLTYYIDVHPEKFDKIDVDGIPIWGFEGTASELLEILHSLAPSIGIDTRNSWWPKAPNALSRRLNEIAHTLREAGIELEFVKSPDRNRVRTIRIRKVSSISSISSKQQILNPVSTIGRSDGPDDNSGTIKEIIELGSVKENSPPHDRTENFETCDSSNIDNKTGNGSSYHSKIRQDYQSVQNGESKPNSSIESEQTVAPTTNRTSRADAQNKPVKNGTSENAGDPHLFSLMLMLKEIEAANGSIVSVSDILRTVYENNETIRSYLGDKLTRRENRKIRDLFVNVVRHKNIDPVKYKPQFLVRWKPTEDKSTEADA